MMRMRWKRAAVVAGGVLLGMSTAAPAGLEDELEARWLGAWVVTAVETYSDCAGLATPNRLNGRRVHSRGRRAFKPGEVARVEKVDAKRSRLDLRVALAEPLLASRQDGPFTLYDEVQCPMELEVELPRAMVKGDDMAGIEKLLSPILLRFDTEDEAKRAKLWNRRRRDPYPQGYERTLAEHAAWRAQQTNAAVEAALERAREEAGRVAERMGSDADYVAGFVKGVEAGRGARSPSCEQLVNRNLAPPVRSGQAAGAAANAAQTRWTQGFQDGQTLALSLDQLRRLPGCFVEVPEEDRAARR
jgi:hypothetical protein